MTVRTTPGIVVAVTRNRGAVKRLMDLERRLLLAHLADERTPLPRVADAPHYVDGAHGSYLAVWEADYAGHLGDALARWQR